MFLGGPDRGDSGLLDPAGLGLAGARAAPGRASAARADYRVGGNAILWPQGAPGDMRVTLLGGYTYTAERRRRGRGHGDLRRGGWTLNGAGIPRMNVGRSYGNVVQLPDGSLVAVGGGAGSAADGTDVNFTGGDERLKQVELLRPGLDAAWTLGPPQRKWRAYHSTALLLPDGRVLSAGDDYWHLGDAARPQGGSPMDVGEIYSPPYLFDGDQLAPRPLIEDAPVAVPYGAPFGIRVRDAARAVLVAPGATTHGADMNQRLVVLETLRTRDGVGLDVRAPASAGRRAARLLHAVRARQRGHAVGRALGARRRRRAGARRAAGPERPPPSRRPARAARPPRRRTATPPGRRRVTLKLTRRGRRLSAAASASASRAAPTSSCGSASRRVKRDAEVHARAGTVTATRCTALHAPATAGTRAVTRR